MFDAPNVWLHKYNQMELTMYDLWYIVQEPTNKKWAIVNGKGETVMWCKLDESDARRLVREHNRIVKSYQFLEANG